MDSGILLGYAYMIFSVCGKRRGEGRGERGCNTHSGRAEEESE